MSLPWFRMYAEAVDDAKLRLLAFEDRWHFIAILCCKCQGVLDSNPNTLDRRMAVKLGLQKHEIDEVKKRLMEADLINETWQPIAWENRQFISDHDGAARVSRYRERKKSSVTLQKRYSNAIEQNRTDTEQSRGAKRATPPPDDFTITEDMKTWAKEQGLEDGTLERETPRFLDYHRAKGTAFKNWKASWRNWMRNVKEWSKDKTNVNNFDGAI